MKCVVIGSGAFGFAIAVNLLKNGNDVTVWCSSKDKLNEIQSGKEIIPGIKIPTEMKFTDNIKEAVIDGRSERNQLENRKGDEERRDENIAPFRVAD